MDSAIVVSIVSAAGSLLVASATFMLTKVHQRRSELQQQKLNHYKVLLSAMSDTAQGADVQEAVKRFALAVNTICLVAPQYVIHSLMDLHDEIKPSNPNKSQEKHDRCVRNLMLAIRKDIGLSGKDREETFNFHIVGAYPKDVDQK